MAFTRLLTFFSSLMLCCSLGHACNAAIAAEVQKTLKESIRLNEAFKRAADGSDDAEYRRLRKQVELYEESTAIPCLKRAVVLLHQTPDALLLDALFAHALSHENSADETESEVLATVFVRHGGMFALRWEKNSTETKTAVAARVKSGWSMIASRYPSSKRSQVESRLKQIEPK